MGISNIIAVDKYAGQNFKLYMKRMGNETDVHQFNPKETSFLDLHRRPKRAF